MGKQRMKKLFNGEKCGICHRPAQGIKYNAISCDSCRVFFRRLVLMKDSCAKNNDPFSLPCMKAHIKQKTPALQGRALILKCQHCRYEACIEAGMKEKYVQGTTAFGDTRTSRKTRGPGDSPPNRSPSGSAAVDPAHGPMEVARTADRTNGQTTNLPIALSLLHSSKDQLIELIRMFWGRYSYEKTSVSTTPKWIAPDNAVAKLQGMDHIKDALHLHVFRLTHLLDMLPYTRFMFTAAQKSAIIMKCYVEVIVLRWVMTSNSDCSSIRGVTGIDYKVDDMCKFGSLWSAKFKEYFEVARQLMRAQPDEEDMALMAVLIILTADRHDTLTTEQRTMICSLQEFFGQLLWQKCKSENTKKKFYMIMNELINLRSRIREVDVSQVSGYKRRIMLTDDVVITV